MLVVVEPGDDRVELFEVLVHDGDPVVASDGELDIERGVIRVGDVAEVRCEPERVLVVLHAVAVLVHVHAGGELHELIERPFALADEAVQILDAVGLRHALVEEVHEHTRPDGIGEIPGEEVELAVQGAFPDDVVVIIFRVQIDPVGVEEIVEIAHHLDGAHVRLIPEDEVEKPVVRQDGFLHHVQEILPRRPVAVGPQRLDRDVVSLVQFRVAPVDRVVDDIAAVRFDVHFVEGVGILDRAAEDGEILSAEVMRADGGKGVVFRLGLGLCRGFGFGRDGLVLLPRLGAGYERHEDAYQKKYGEYSFFHHVPPDLAGQIPVFLHYNPTRVNCQGFRRREEKRNLLLRFRLIPVDRHTNPRQALSASCRGIPNIVPENGSEDCEMSKT